VHSMWIQDATIQVKLEKGKAKYTLRIPELFMKAIGQEEGVKVAQCVENGNLKVVPYEKG